MRRIKKPSVITKFRRAMMEGTIDPEGLAVMLMEYMGSAQLKEFAHAKGYFKPEQDDSTDNGSQAVGA